MQQFVFGFSQGRFTGKLWGWIVPVLFCAWLMPTVGHLCVLTSCRRWDWRKKLKLIWRLSSVSWMRL